MIYKKSYTGMFLFNFGLYFISLLIGLSILYFIEVGNLPIYNMLIAATAMIGIVFLIGIIIDFILSIFSKDKIYMDNEYIEYKNDKYFVSHIKFVEFYIGSIGKTMQLIEKYEVDMLGNVHKVEKEKRMDYSGRKNK